RVERGIGQQEGCLQPGVLLIGERDVVLNGGNGDRQRQTIEVADRDRDRNQQDEVPFARHGRRRSSLPAQRQQADALPRHGGGDVDRSVAHVDPLRRTEQLQSFLGLELRVLFG